MEAETSDLLDRVKQLRRKRLSREKTSRSGSIPTSLPSLDLYFPSTEVDEPAQPTEVVSYQMTTDEPLRAQEEFLAPGEVGFKRKSRKRTSGSYFVSSNPDLETSVNQPELTIIPEEQTSVQLTDSVTSTSDFSIADVLKNIKSTSHVAVPVIPDQSKKSEKVSEEFVPRPIVLEYYDDDGNLLTPKEAYKHLSHKFSNRLPGPKRRAREAEKRNQRSTSARVSQEKANLETIKKVMKSQQSAEIVIQNPSLKGIK
ncbi:hypothetical protein RCL1_004691 [Eukaryota sp. TZLM3-RCL]